eukprot:15354738-Ditylum_brightwellii.AAC.2
MLAIRDFALSCRETGGRFDPRTIDVTTARQLIEWRKTKNTEEEMSEESTVTDPQFQGASNWCKWKEAAKTYMDTVVGAKKTPLIYLLRPYDDPPASIPGTHVGSRDYMIAVVCYGGSNYRSDCSRLCHALKGWLGKTEAWNHIKCFERMSEGQEA